MPKYFETKKDSLEQAVLEATSPAQSEKIELDEKSPDEMVFHFKSFDDAKKFNDYAEKNKQKFGFKEVLHFEKGRDAAASSVAIRPKDGMSLDKYETLYQSINKIAKKMKSSRSVKFIESIEIAEKKLTDEDKLDPVNPDAVKKKFKDRKDKDIDNDGDVDSSDKFLHKRRKAISKAVKEQNETLIQRAANEITKMWEKSAKVKSEEEMDDEDEEEPKNGKKTMTGKPMSKVETAPKDKIEK